MNERWQEDLLSKLETHLETLSDDTLKFISASLAAERVAAHSQAAPFMSVSNPEQTTSTSASLTQNVDINTTSRSSSAVLELSNNGFTADWEPLNAFSEFLGTDLMDTYWDICGLETPGLWKAPMP